MAWISRAGLALAAALAASTLAVQAAEAAATPLPKEGMTLEEVHAWLTGLGLQTQVNTEHSVIATKINNQIVGIFVGDCQNERCRSVQYYYAITFPNGVRPDDASAAMFINGWNAKFRWTRAYVDDKRNPAMEMDYSLTPGVDSDALTTSLITFVGAMPLFSQYLNQPDQPQAQPQPQPKQ